MAVISAQDGSVYQGPFETISFGSPLRFPDGFDSSKVDSFDPLVFRKESRLLVVRACPEEDDKACALFYYEWQGKKFKLLQKFAPSAPPAT